MLHLIDGFEAAKYLGLAESTLRKKRLDGSGPRYVRLGRTIRYRPEDLASWAANHVADSTSQYAA